MPYPECKVYYDGSHYIAIPHTTRPYKPKKRPQDEIITVVKQEVESPQEAQQTKNENTTSEDNVEETNLAPMEQPIKESTPTTESVSSKSSARQMTKRELFDEIYKENIFMKYEERKAILIAKLRPYFMDDEATANYVESNLERKKRNLISRRIRMTRKANLANFNYFCTFTYDSQKHTEETFSKKLKKMLENFATRKGWKYMGVWERSPKKHRLHFHGIFHIPDGTMPGEMIDVNYYNFNTHQRQITHQNTFFNEKFGRSDFESIDDKDRLGSAMAYIMKYIEKSGEKIVYSRGLPQFFISDIMEEDVVCPFGMEDKKLLLYDDFICWDEGTYMGTVSEDTIRLMRTSN